MFFSEFSFAQGSEEFLIDTISTVTCEQFNPDVASDDTNYIVVWGDQRNGFYEIHGAIIDDLGTVITKTEVYAHSNRWNPSVTFDGINYLVCYHLWDMSLLAMRYDKDGLLLDPSEYTIFYDGGDTWVVDHNTSYGLERYLIVYNREWLRGSSVEGRFFSPGITFRNGITLEVGGNVNVSFGVENFFIVIDAGADIRALMVDTTGVLIDTNYVQISVKSKSEENPAVAFDGSNYLVVWQEKDSLDNYDIYGARVTSSGEVLDTNGMPISTSAENQINPKVTFNGKNYLVVWQDYRNGNDFDIYGAEVSTEGGVIRSFSISMQEGDQIQPALSRGSDNQILVVYSGWTSEYDGKLYNSMRIWGKMLGEPVSAINDNSETLVRHFNLQQNYPNPFNPTTTIKYQISDMVFVTLMVYDVLGREIATLVNEEKPVGTYEITWYSDNLPSGIYFYRLEAGSFVETKKMVLLR